MDNELKKSIDELTKAVIGLKLEVEQAHLKLDDLSDERIRLTDGLSELQFAVSELTTKFQAP